MAYGCVHFGFATEVPDPQGRGEHGQRARAALITRRPRPPEDLGRGGQQCRRRGRVPSETQRGPDHRQRHPRLAPAQPRRQARCVGRGGRHLARRKSATFPDSNVAASLQRLPGVSIQRDGMRAARPTASPSAGFGGDFNETLVDGRRCSTATGGRSIDFSTVGSGLHRRADRLQDAGRARSRANSIGATINISVSPAARPSGLPHRRDPHRPRIQDRSGKKSCRPAVC